MKRFGNSTYQRPARSGISYMIAPLVRTYPAPNARSCQFAKGNSYTQATVKLQDEMQGS